MDFVPTNSVSFYLNLKFHLESVKIITFSPGKISEFTSSIEKYL